MKVAKLQSQKERKGKESAPKVAPKPTPEVTTTVTTKPTTKKVERDDYLSPKERKIVDKSINLFITYKAFH